jgi:hypothetical protein
VIARRTSAELVPRAVRVVVAVFTAVLRAGNAVTRVVVASVTVDACRLSYTVRTAPAPCTGVAPVRGIAPRARLIKRAARLSRLTGRHTRTHPR